jgi:regulator of sigma E protease
MDLLTTVPAFLLALAILIVIHELGHYAIARRCGVKVLRFSVGFGRPLLRWVSGPDRTEWVISAVPLGGYVKMLDENDPDCQPIAAADLPRAFNRQSVAKRAAIVIGGPAANLLLAVGLYWLLNVVGSLEPVPYLGPAPQGSLAASAGVEDGDLVLDIDERAVRSWSDLFGAMVKQGVQGGAVVLHVRSIEGPERQLRLVLPGARSEEIDEAWFKNRLGLVRGGGRAVVRGLDPKGPATQAGLAVGDQVLSIDGAPVRTSAQLTQRVRANQGQEQTWQIERDGQRLQRSLAPTLVTLTDGSQVRRVGIDLQEWQTVRYAPLEALTRAAASTWDTSIFSLRMIGRMIEGRESLRSISGALTIADFAGKTARIGLVAYLSFLALVSISLGVLNLLPVPILDGGHLLYYAVEVVKGSPPSLRAVELGQRLGIGMLVLLTALALYNDLTRLLS